MPITVVELFGERKETIINNIVQNADMRFVVTGAGNEQFVAMACLNDIPLWYSGVPRGTIVIGERVNNTTWKVDVEYAWPEKKIPPDPGAPAQLWDFDTSGGTSHVTQSIATVAVYTPAGIKAADNHGAIGYNGKAIEGVDIVTPVFQFTVVKTMTTAEVTNAYIQTLFGITGYVNSTPFLGMFDPGEVLFLGASGSQKGADEWSLTYRFAASPNRTGLTVGAPVVPGTGTYASQPGTGTAASGVDTGTGPIIPGTGTGPYGGIAGIAKKGWEYLWIRYDKAISGTLDVEIPCQVSVEQVYLYADFGLLGL